jgi:uncharacterized protein YecE (DUF72 family)
MDFGKLHDISKVDFSLPPDASGTTIFLENRGKKAVLPKVYVGPTGWAMPQWVGKTYPKKATSKDFLKFYSQQFNTIELNTTHYRIPDKATIDKWKNDTTEDFKFCPKVPQTISHHKNLGLTESNLPLFLENIARLDEKLGCCFLQLPPHFGVKQLPLLERFFQAWGKAIPLAVEIRHEDIFKHQEQFELFFNTLENYGMSSVITDVAGRRDVLHQRLTTTTALVRFVGNNLDETDYQRLDEWALRIKTWFDMGLEELYFFTHEPDNLLAPELTAAFCDKINQLLGIAVRGPIFFDTPASMPQMSLF